MKGFIDKTGKTVVEPQYRAVAPFSGGLAYVEGPKSGDFKWAYVDTTGTPVWQE